MGCMNKKVKNLLTNKQIRFAYLSRLGLFNAFSDEWYLKKLFKVCLGTTLNIEQPLTFNEKMQWLKLYDRKPVYNIMADKYAVKSYVSDLIGAEYVISSLGGPWKSFSEIEFEKLPGLQKKFIRKCYKSGKMVITATQMLDSMIRNPRPTRAEVTDVANAVYDGTDAVMLSGETAQGKYPVEAVRTMTKIALEVESSLDVALELKMSKAGKKIAATLARNMVEATELLPVKAIVFDTWTGRTGRYIAEFRPRVPVYAMCYRGFIMRELALFYGVYAYPLEKKTSKEDMVESSIDILKKDGKVLECDLLGFIGGSFAAELGASYLEFKYV